MNKKRKSFIPPEVKGLVFTFLAINLFFYFIGLLDKKNAKKREIERIETKRRWYESFQIRSINSISFVLNDKYVSNFNDHGSSWRRVEKVYINNKIVNPDSMYNKDDFIIKNCDNLYYYFTNSGVDSVIYQFYPKKMLLKHRTDKDLFYVSKALIIMKSYNERFKRYLPKCWD